MPHTQTCWPAWLYTVPRTASSSFGLLALTFASSLFRAPLGSLTSITCRGAGRLHLPAADVGGKGGVA